MSFQSIRLSREGAVATLTITSKMGALGPAFWDETRLALADLGDARALVLRGEDVFSAGLDVRAYLPQLLPALGDEAAFAEVVAPMHAVTEGLGALPIPVVAAVHGWCVGAGLELIAACDLRLCSADARFQLPEVRLGITADLGGLQRLPRLLGQGRAAHLALTGDVLGAEQAERWGLVTEVLPEPDALFARAQALAAQLAALPPRAVEGTKHVLGDGLPHTQSLEGAVRWNARYLSVEGLKPPASSGQPPAEKRPASSGQSPTEKLNADG